MSTFAVEVETAMALGVRLTQDSLHVDLADGRTVSVPLAWYPRLLCATPAERNGWRLMGKGRGIHWRAVDEDVSVAGLLAGRASAESQSSLAKWLNSRAPLSVSSSAVRSRSAARKAP